MQLERGHGGRRWGAMAAAALTGALGVAAARPAQASCQGEPYGLLWSYPANGEQEVPIDADLMVNGRLDGLPSLAGEPLTGIAPGIFELGLLAPDTRYEVRWQGAAIVFTTGSASTSPPRQPIVDVRVTRNPVDFARCPLVPSQGCFDTGQHTAVRFDAGPARAWLVDVVSCGGSVRRMLWPSACGVPVVESEDRRVCASLRSTQGAGFSESTGVICSVPDVPPGTLPDTNCVGAWPPESAPTLAADDGVTVGSVSGLVESTGEPSRDEPPEGPSSFDGAASPAPATGCRLATEASGRARGGIGAMVGAGLVALMSWRRRRARGSSSSGGPSRSSCTLRARAAARLSSPSCRASRPGTRGGCCRGPS